LKDKTLEKISEYFPKNIKHLNLNNNGYITNDGILSML
jgi:hypothetical protein